MGRTGLAQAQPREQASGRADKVLWHGVTAPVAIGVAAQQSGGAQPAATGSAMLLKRLQCISRAAGLEAASAAQPGLEKQPVNPDKVHQTALGQTARGGEYGGQDGQSFHHAQPARPSRPSSSARAACASAVERAEMNSVVAKPARNRTSHMPLGKRSAWRAKHARICRLSRLRVTARRAWRLGTTHPIQSAGKVLSTAGRTCCAGAVDKSCETPLFLCACVAKGPPVTWCSAK